VALVAAGCGGPFPQSTLHPVSDFATSIDQLFRSIVWWAALVFVVVEGLLVYVLIRFRDRGGDGTPEPVHGNALLEVGWTLAPAVILVLIAVPTIRTIWTVDNPPDDANALQVEVVGHQWWWEFNYPGLGVTTANEMHVPVDRTVQLSLRSADVIHSFWVPRIGGKRDVNPGETTGLWFTVDSAGVYPGQCAEFCGTSHSLMKMEVVAQDSASFRRWVERQRQPAEAPASELAQRGRELFMGQAACFSCHAVEGTMARGAVGPELTHVAGRRTIAAGILPNDSTAMARWLQDPQAVKPGNLMRIRDLDDETIAALIAYLQTLE
jgi:cytochrome c oxidase subunit 2